MSRLDDIKQDFDNYRSRIERLKEAEQELKSLVNQPVQEQFHLEIESILSKINKPLLVDAVEQEIKVLREKVSLPRQIPPVISVALSDSNFEMGNWTQTELIIKNAGSSAVSNLNVDIPDDIEADTIDSVPMLAHGDEIRLPVRFRPRQQGMVPLKMSVSFHDEQGKKALVEKTVSLDVAPQIVAPTFPTELLSVYSSPEFIARGGFARVFRARRKRDDVLVAVKIPIELEPEIGKSFLKEIENWRKLEHDNITRLLDYNILPAVFLEMELCQQSLENLAKPILIDRAAFLLMEIGRGLDYAHGCGVVHRDLKPSNILFSGDVPKISDWGLSKVKSESRMTLTTSFSPLYAAPEQYSPKSFGQSDERTDIFQLGIMFYELVTGQLPFAGDDISEISYAVVNEDPRLASEINAEAKDVEQMLSRCLQKNKDDRYQSVSDFLKDLAGYLGIDFRKSLALSRNQLEKVKLCTDLVEVYASLGDCQNCLLYLKNLQVFVTANELSGRIGEEIEALDFYVKKEISMVERTSGIHEIIHLARMGA